MDERCQPFPLLIKIPLGGRCSKFLAAALHDALFESASFEKSLRAAFIDAFRSANARFLDIADRAGINDGSTALCLALRGGRMTVANVGDCRLVVVGPSSVEQISRDHKPGSRAEQARIAALGGTVVCSSGVPRVNGILAVSRAFGNLALRDVVRPDPEIFERNLTPDDRFLVMGSDGVWDVVRNRDVLDACWAERGRSCQHIADAIVLQALLLGSQDNVSCIVIGVADYFLAFNDAQRIFRADSLPSFPRMQAPRDGRGMVTSSSSAAPQQQLTVVHAPLLVRPKSQMLSYRRLRVGTNAMHETSEEIAALVNYRAKPTRLPRVVRR